MKKRGQVTIFIIIAVMIVVLGILVFLFYPQIKTSLELESKNPSQFIQECLEDKVKVAVTLLSLHGGSINPGHYILYDNTKIEYLCYTDEYYQTCVMQQPMLKQHIEEEIKNEIGNVANNCFDSLKESYEKKAYNVNLYKNSMNVELLPKRIVVNFNNTLTITKDSTEIFDKFNVILNNNLYELVSIVNSILNWEARYGDSETTIYMNYYHDLKVEKKKQTDGSTIYILTDRNTLDKFQFASRSVAWPPGYGING